MTHPIHDVDDAAISRAVANRVRGDIAEWAALAEALAEPELVEKVEVAGRAVVETLRAGGTVLVAGNGGSAAIASHVAAEFLGKCIHDRAPLPAINLAESISSLTAIGNDYGYDEVFVRGVKAFGRPGDVLIAMTTSGRSPNILAALEAAAARSVTTIVLTGGTGGDVVDRADHVLIAPSSSTPRIQEAHMVWTHAWCEAVDVVSQ